MSNTLEPSQTHAKTQFTAQKSADLNAEDLELVAEILSLIQGHVTKIAQMPVVSGVTVLQGFLLVALHIPGHTLEINSEGEWLLDGQPITELVARK